MKKLYVAILVLGVAGTMAMAQTNVSSVNVVGYVNVTMNSNSWNLIKIPLDPIATNYYTASDVFGDALPENTVAWHFDYSQAWVKDTYAFDFGEGKNVWQPGTNKYMSMFPHPLLSHHMTLALKEKYLILPLLM